MTIETDHSESESLYINNLHSHNSMIKFILLKNRTLRERDAGWVNLNNMKRIDNVRLIQKVMCVKGQVWLSYPR